MYYVRLSLFAWILCLLWSAGSLSISFPPSGTPTAAFDSQMVVWKRDTNDPSVQFYLQRIKLDQPGGPTVKSTPVPIDNSLGSQGTSPMMFNRAGLFEILAVNIQNGQPFFTTEITVAPNPTSSGGPPPPTGTSASPNKKQGVNMMEPGTPKSSSSSATSTNTNTLGTSVASASTSVTGDHTALLVGAVVGGVGLLLLIGNILLCLRRRQHMSQVQTISSTTRRSEESTQEFISPFALGRPISPSEEKQRPRSIQREGSLPGLQSQESNIPSAPAAGQLLPSRIQRIRSALNISMNGAMKPLSNNASFENLRPSPMRNSGNIRPFRHQDSGLRILASFRSHDSGVTELPPDYSSV